MLKYGNGGGAGAMRDRFYVRGTIDHKRTRNAWNRRREVMRGMGLMGFKKIGGMYGYGNGCE